MQIIIISPKSAFKKKKILNRLKKLGTVFYEQNMLDLQDIKELYNKEEKILGLDEVRVRGGYKAINNFLEKFNNVKFVCGISSRYNEFNLEKAKKLDIAFCNNPDTTSQSVAELAIMHMFMLIRNQPLTVKRSFHFYGVNNPGREVKSLTAGILGYGNIGSKIAYICDKLGMEVKFWSRKEKSSKFQQVSMKQLLKQDVIFICLPTEKGTKKIFDNNFFNNLNKDQFIIDTSASDALYDKNKLIKKVNKKKLLGFGFEAELPTSKYLESEGNITTTPHIGFITKESYDRWYKGWVETILSCYKGNPINKVG